MGLLQQDQKGQLTLACPTCRQVTPVPANGVAGLQSDFRINQLLELVDEDLEAPSPEESESSETIENTPESPTSHVNISLCSEHVGREIELFCESCSEAICYKCIKKGGKHNGHDYEEVDEAVERYLSREIPSSLETIEKALTLLDTCRGEVFHQREAIEADIHKTKIVDVRKTELVDQLHQLAQAKTENLAAQKDQIETIQTQLNMQFYSMRESLNTGNQGEELLKKTTALKQVKELLSMLQPDVLTPNTKADMVFTTSSDKTDERQNYGEVSTSGSPDPPKCYATDIRIAAVGEKSTAVLHMLTCDGRPCKDSLDYITCELVSDITDDQTGGSIERGGRTSQYEISYQPTIKGRHQLHIKVLDQHIKGSPFPVAVMAPVETLGTPILTIDLDRPRGLVLTEQLELVATAEYGPCVSVFNYSGEKLRSFGIRDPGKGKNGFYGVAVDGEGNIYVADEINNCLKKFTVEGLFLESVRPEGCESGQFGSVFGVAYHPTNGRLFLTLPRRDCILILNSDLSYFGAFGERGHGNGQFKGPHEVAFDSTGNVFVADRANMRIQVFTAEGVFLRMFHGMGSPFGLAIDSSDRVYVSNWSENYVTVFTSGGQLIASFGSTGSDPGQFLCPSGLAVDSSGVVYVCDYGNDRIQLF